MWPLFFNRDKQRASSFTTCLLTVIVVFGGLGFYYFKYFQWRHFDNPKEGLTYVDDSKSSQLNTFREDTVSKVIDPTVYQLNEIKDMRKKTKFGKETYPELEQNSKEVRNRFLAIMNEGRLRRIPKGFKKEYERTMMGLKYAYDSVNYLEEAMGYEPGTLRKAKYDEGVKSWKKAKKYLAISREYFHGNGWQAELR